MLIWRTDIYKYLLLRKLFKWSIVVKYTCMVISGSNAVIYFFKLEIMLNFFTAYHVAQKAIKHQLFNARHSANLCLRESCTCTRNILYVKYEYMVNFIVLCMHIAWVLETSRLPAASLLLCLSHAHQPMAKCATCFGKCFSYCSYCCQEESNGSAAEWITWLGFWAVIFSAPG